MKLIIAGSTGYVATELIKQALSNPAITSVTALARRITPVPQTETDISKLKSVACDDFMNYSEDVKRALEGADACIWLLAITPAQSRKVASEDARRICVDFTIRGLEIITQLPRGENAEPLRFIYVSGALGERDPSKKPWILGDYLLMRGEVESRVLEFARESKGMVQACIAKPGTIDGTARPQGMFMSILSSVGRSVIGLPSVHVKQIGATLLKQAVEGIEKETLLNEDLVRIGVGLLEEGSL